MQVTGRVNWEIKLRVRLESCSGVPVALALELCQQVMSKPLFSHAGPELLISTRIYS